MQVQLLLGVSEKGFGSVRVEVDKFSKLCREREGAQQVKVKVNVQVEVLINIPSRKQVRFTTDVKLPVHQLNSEGDRFTSYTNTFIASGVRKEWEPFVERFSDRYYMVHETMLFSEHDGVTNYLDLECRNNSMTAHLALLAEHYPNHEFVYDLSNVPADYFKERLYDLL